MADNTADRTTTNQRDAITPALAASLANEPIRRDAITAALAVSIANEPIRPSPVGVSESLLYRELSHAIIGAAIEVHRHLGAGQLESVYEAALATELWLREMPFRRQVRVVMDYKGRDIGDLVVDLIVEDKILVELTAVSEILPVHRAQVLGYLRATQLRLGLLINFNVSVLYRGVQRLIR